MEFSNVENSDKFTITINDKDITLTAESPPSDEPESTNVEWLVDKFVDILNGTERDNLDGDDIGEFQEVEAAKIDTNDEELSDQTEAASKFVVKAKDEGKPFFGSAAGSGALSTSTTDGGGNDTQTFTTTEIQSSQGPHHWDDGDNWEPTGVPSASDDIFIEGGNSDILYGLETSAGTTFNSLIIESGYSGKIGLPRQANGFVQYRPQYLKAGFTTVRIGEREGPGAGRIKLDLETQSTITIFETGGSSDTNQPTVRIKGTNSNNTFTIMEGDVGLGLEAGDSTTMKKIQQNGGILQLGDSVTVGTDGLEKTGGELFADDATINGDLTIRG